MKKRQSFVGYNYSMSRLNLKQISMKTAKRQVSEGQYDIALDPSYPVENVKMPSRSEIEAAFGLTKPMKNLRKALGEFGLDAIAEDIESQCEDYVKNEIKWAEVVRRWWWATSPYQTTNLRHSITIDENEFPKAIEVKLDENLLLRFSGVVLKGWRGKVDKEMRRIPGHNYLSDAEHNNISAAYTPGGARQHISDFSRVVWDEYAVRARKELFA